jgi:alpha-ketoglutarate-dependent taurine dioxygenase
MTRTVPAAPRSLQTPAAAPLTVDRLGAHHGAQVSGIDLATAGDAQIAAVRAALVEHEVLFSSGRDLDEEHPEIYARDAADNGFADVWHTDVTFVRRPPLGSILRAVQVPHVGGDTQWADAEAACASLSPAVRVLADRLTAVHDGTREFGYYLAHRGGNRWDG